MKKTYVVLTVLLLSGAMYACSDDKKDAVEIAETANEKKDSAGALALAESDADFLVFAAESGMKEVEASNIAQNKATSPELKAFGAEMVKDHTASSNELKSLAQNKNVTLPVALSEAQQTAVGDLNAATGTDFDKAYIIQMVDDHQEVVDKFKDASENAKDPDVKAFATKNLPGLQIHLEHAKKLQESMK